VNANHARPLLAFWALAVAAAIITGTGLRASTRDVTVSAGSPAPVQTSGAPEVVLGGLLRADTSGVLTNPLAPDLWSSLAAGGATKSHAVQVAAPSTARPRTRSHATAHAQPVTVPTDTSGVTKTLTTPSPKPRKDPPGQTKTTATATATPTGGHGNGKGSGSDHTGNGKAP